MAKNTKLADEVVNAQANVLGEMLSDGFIDIYDGAQPESANDSISKQTLCVSLRFGTPAFGPAQKGIISANTIASGVAVATVSNATWARVFRADHKTKVMDVSVGTKDANIILPTTNIVRGVTVQCSSFLHTVAKTTQGV